MDGEVKAMEVVDATPTTATGSDTVNERRDKRPLSASSATDETEEKKKKLEGDDCDSIVTGDMVHGTQASDSNSVLITKIDQTGKQASGSVSDPTASVTETPSYKKHEHFESDIFETDETSAEATRALMYKLFKMSDPAQFQIEGAKKGDISLPITKLVKTLFSPEKANPQSPDKTDNTDKNNLPSRESKTAQSLKLECVLNENNRFLRSISSTLENVNTILKCNTDETTALSDRVDHIEALVDNSYKILDNKISLCDQTSSNLTKLVSKSYEYVDEKFSNLKEAIPETIAEMSLEFDAKLKVHKTDVVLAISSEVAKIPSASQLQKKIQASFDSKLEQKLKEVDSQLSTHTESVMGAVHESIQKIPISDQIESKIEDNLMKKVEERFNEKLRKIEMNNSSKLAEVQLDLKSLVERESARDERITRLEKTYDDQISELKLKFEALSEKVEAYHMQLANRADKTNDGRVTQKCSYDTIEGASNITKADWRQHKTKMDDLSERMYSIERRSEIATKHRNKMDSVIRKSNVIFDKLHELPNENTKDKISDILKLALRQEDYERIRITNAYRLGKLRSGTNPRKILVELADSGCKDLLLQYARQITKVGNNGAPYYVNEDMPDALKRSKTDIFKYKRYLIERNHKVEQLGDFFIIDDRKHHLRDLNKLPIGMRLMDSRTLFGRGTVAFQSALSPLSNLYPCRLKYNGLHYTSSEQAYQYAKAIHHGLPLLAKDIKAEIDPHDIMNMGNSIQIDCEWAEKRFDTMENIVRHKAEQVGDFYELLKQTGSHRIVENTSCDTWGSACAFNSMAIWNGTFRGQNRMGKILERIRDSI